MGQYNIWINVDKNLKKLLKEEDLDRDLKITKDDLGPKRFLLETLDNTYIEIEGHYPLSNLLQILAHAHQNHKKKICLDLTKVYQNPVDQINEQINHYYWDALTRRMDEKGLIELLEDPKRAEEKVRLYVPYQDEDAFQYFKKCVLTHPYLKLKVKRLPKELDSKTIEKLNEKPGLLTLSILSDPARGNPYVVPGGRFNEMYGWDSYFIIEGLLASKRIPLAFSMFNHLIYQIKHYKKILNANRSYYLTRSQPPFLTSIIRLLLKNNEFFSKELLKNSLQSAIDEYEGVWMSRTRLCENGLNRYFGEGSKIPLEVEPDHFDLILEPFASKNGLSIHEYRKKYNNKEIKEPKLDIFFMHDRSMRESGHDTTRRLIGQSAYLNPVDLNSLLYKYESDIAYLIETYYSGNFQGDYKRNFSSKDWREKALKRSNLMRDLMWDSKKKMFFDYNFKLKKRTFFESVTTFYPLFVGLASNEEAEALIKNALPLFECKGGLVSTTENSRGEVSSEKPLKQWDYPFGWAPHQMLFWEGCQRYGYLDIAKRVAYKWLYMITKEAKDYNGVLAEKYDVVNLSHNLLAEYGNEGLKFGLYPNGGFGWVNASYLKGQEYLDSDHLIALKELKDPDLLF